LRHRGRGFESNLRWALQNEPSCAGTRGVQGSRRPMGRTDRASCEGRARRCGDAGWASDGVAAQERRRACDDPSRRPRVAAERAGPARLLQEAPRGRSPPSFLEAVCNMRAKVRRRCPPPSPPHHPPPAPPADARPRPAAPAVEEEAHEAPEAQEAENEAEEQVERQPHPNRSPPGPESVVATPSRRRRSVRVRSLPDAVTTSRDAVRGRPPRRPALRHSVPAAAIALPRASAGDRRSAGAASASSSLGPRISGRRGGCGAGAAREQPPTTVEMGMAAAPACSCTCGPRAPIQIGSSGRHPARSGSALASSSLPARRHRRGAASHNHIADPDGMAQRRGRHRQRGMLLSLQRQGVSISCSTRSLARRRRPLCGSSSSSACRDAVTGLHWMSLEAGSRTRLPTADNILHVVASQAAASSGQSSARVCHACSAATLASLLSASHPSASLIRPPAFSVHAAAAPSPID
jgi:hypothetical protein